MAKFLLPKPFSSKKHGQLGKVDKIVIHAMGEYIEAGNGDIYTAWGFLEKIGLSVHHLVTPSGVVITGAGYTDLCYHAKGFNRGSIGIEVLVPGIHNYNSFLETIEQPWVLEKQQLRTQMLVWNILKLFPEATLYRHSDLDPQRKKDPGAGFPWEDFDI